VLDDNVKKHVIKIEVPLDLAHEFADLVARCYKENPNKKDLRELKKTFEDMPQLWSAVFNLGRVVRNRAIENFALPEAAVLAMNTNIAEMQKDLGYDTSPALERLLIDNVINCWVRFQWAEFRYSSKMDGSLTFREGEYWNKLLNAAQRRYLRSCETLQRIRKITHGMTQVNIASEGGQQVNIGQIGQVVKGE